MARKVSKEIIDEQDRIIGELTREIYNLKEAAYMREEWLRKAKKEAGYMNETGFDIVWRETLENARKYTLIKRIKP